MRRHQLIPVFYFLRPPPRHNCTADVMKMVRGQDTSAQDNTNKQRGQQNKNHNNFIMPTFPFLSSAVEGKFVNLLAAPIPPRALATIVLHREGWRRIHLEIENWLRQCGMRHTIYAMD